MNVIALDIADINLQNVFFHDPKKNIIMNGIFTKIMYTSQWFTMNGIYLYLPLEMDVVGEYPYFHFSVNSIQNKNILNALYLLEKNIIHSYYKHNNYNSNNRATAAYGGDDKQEKIFNYGLNKWLQYGQIRIYHLKGDPTIQKKHKFILKISGIWETSTEIGITYKLMESSQFSTNPIDIGIHQHVDCSY